MVKAPPFLLPHSSFKGAYMPHPTFGGLVDELRFGELTDELNEKLSELVNACVNTGKVGTLTLSIKLKPGKAGEVEVTDTVKSSVPQLERGSYLMYPTPEGRLQRHDPRQIAIDGLKTIGREAPKEFKTIK